MDQQKENHHHYFHSGNNLNEIKGGVEEDEGKTKEFRILGQSMTLKRRREPDSGSSSTSPSSTSRGIRVSSNDMESRKNAVRVWGNQSLQDADPDIFKIMEKKKQRQYKGIELIASENFVCKAVMEALGSHLKNKYSEGFPVTRYYDGNQYIDEIETLCCERALAAFGLDSESWGVNVQSYSCTSALIILQADSPRKRMVRSAAGYRRPTMSSLAKKRPKFSVNAGRDPLPKSSKIPPKPSDRAEVQSKEARLPDAGPISLDDQDVQIALKLSDDLHLNEA